MAGARDVVVEMEIPRARGARARNGRSKKEPVDKAAPAALVPYEPLPPPPARREEDRSVNVRIRLSLYQRMQEVAHRRSIQAARPYSVAELLREVAERAFWP